MSNANRFPVSLIGKSPARADFIRIQLTDPAAIALDRWLQAAATELRVQRAALAESPSRFIFAPADAANVLVGVLAPSRDRAGREYPVACFATLPGTVAHETIDFLPAGMAGFLDAAEALCRALPGLDYEALQSEVRALAVPTAGQLGELSGRPAEPATESARALLGEMFQASEEGSLHFGVQTLIAAAARHRGQGPSLKATVLDCPAREDTHVYFWLQAARRLLQWKQGIPSSIWNLPKLLVGLGQLPPAALGWLTAERVSSSRYWPLRTDQPQALQRAQSELKGPVAEVLADPEAGLPELLRALAAG